MSRGRFGWGENSWQIKEVVRGNVTLGSSNDGGHHSRVWPLLPLRVTLDSSRVPGPNPPPKFGK